MTNPLYIDGSTSSAVLDSVGLNPVTSPSSLARTDRFWSSQRASLYDPVKEVLEVNLSTASLINRIYFEAAKFPQTITIEYTTDNGTNWIPVTDALTGLELTPTILKSFPAVLPSPNAVAGHTHPQHDYDGHWERFLFKVTADTMQKIRFVIQRNSSGSGPIDASGSSVPYSVALQNIEIGYEITSEDDVPREALEPLSKQVSQTFASTTDVFKSNLSFAKRTRSASAIVDNTDDSAPLIWKSEPQPFPEAVVNLYADLRDDQGNARVIDRIFVDPIYEGPHISLYYSNDTTVSEFNSSRSALTNLDVTLTNAKVNSSSGVLSLGTFGETTSATPGTQPTPTLPDAQIAFKAAAALTISDPPSLVPYFVSINNQKISFDPSLPWWLGLQFTLTGDPLSLTADNILHPFFSCAQFEIGYYSASGSSFVYLNTVSGDSNVIAYNLDKTLPVQIVAASVGGNLHLAVQQQDASVSNDIPETVAFTSAIPSTLYLGTDTSTSRYSNLAISAFVLKQESWVDDSFLDNALGFSRVSVFPGEVELGRKNALIRFDPTKLTVNAPSGLIGGPAFTYENLTWTPIPREYAMHRGLMELPPTKARFWNLEVTNLRPEVYEKFIPVTRNVKTFPTWIQSAWDMVNSLVADRQSSDDFNAETQAFLTNSVSYLDNPTYVGTGRDENQPSATEVYIPEDYDARLRMRALGNEWKYRQWHPDVRSPRFPIVCQHDYDISSIRQESNVSYFAGLRQIKFFKSQKTSPQDLPVIEEYFLNDEGINNKGSWFLVDGGLTSGSSVYARTTSVLIPTQRAVKAVQFATQQSDNKYISVQGEFNDANYNPVGVNAWSNHGDGRILGLTQINTASDNSLLVTRQGQTGFYADISINYVSDPTFPQFATGTYGAITRYDPLNAPSLTTRAGYSTTYGDMQNALASPQFIGGIKSSAVVSPNGGRLYAAAKVTATEALTAPLWVQIIDADSGAVLAEEQSNVGKNDIQEWYTGVDARTFGAENGKTWGDVAGKINYQTFSDNFTRSDSSTLGTMNPSGQAWSTPGTSLQIVSNQAKCTSTGQRSEFNTGTPWGTWNVTLGTSVVTGTHGSSVKLLDLGGVYLNNDGTLESNNTASTNTLINPPANNKAYSFQFVPTVIATGATADPTLFPYSIVITENSVYVQTVSFTRAFSSLRALMGATNQIFTSMSWTPGSSQTYDQNNFQQTIPVPNTSELKLTGAGDSSYTWVDGTKHNWWYTGSYTYGTNRYATTIASLAPGGTFLSNPSGLAVSANATGGDANGDFASGATWFWVITAINNAGETQISNRVTSAIGAGGSASLTWTTVTGASGYNIYRGLVSGSEVLVGTVYESTSFLDIGNPSQSGATFPTTNTTNAAGTVAVVQTKEWYGTLAFSCTQMPSGLTNSQVILAYLDYNPSQNYILALYADGTIKNIAPSASTDAPPTGTGSAMGAKASMTVRYPPPVLSGFTPTGGPLHIRYVPAQKLSSSFRATWGIPSGDTQAIVFIQGSVVGVYSGTNIWTSTVRGIGGANNGTGAGQYSIIEGFSWSPEGSILAANIASPTWSEITANNTIPYGVVSHATAPSVQNLAVRIVQKTPTNDYWYVQNTGLFWDPVIWEFSCDDGASWWEAIDVKNDQLSVLPFPIDRTEYKKFRWRVTSYSPDVVISCLRVRPWYEGDVGSMPIRPTQLTYGPNLVPTDHYSKIESDPMWNTWSNPIPRWWWEGIKSTTITA